MRYFHVMKKQDAWHLYQGDALDPILVHRERTIVVRRARHLSRSAPAKIVVHREQSINPSYQGKYEL